MCAVTVSLDFSTAFSYFYSSLIETANLKPNNFFVCGLDVQSNEFGGCRKIHIFLLLDIWAKSSALFKAAQGGS